MGLIARGNDVVAIGIAPKALGILRPFARAVVIQHVAAVISLAAAVIVIDAARARQTRAVRVIRSRRVRQAGAGVVIRSLNGLGGLGLGCGGLERFALGILKRSAQLIELGRLRVDLPHRQQTTRTVDTTLQHSALVIGSIVAIHIHNDLSAHLKGIALGLHRGVPLLHGTITIAAIINGLYQRRLGRRRSNRIGQCCRVGISCAGACQKCHGQSGGKGSGFRFS